MVSIREMMPPFWAIRACLPLALTAAAIGWIYRHAEEVREPPEAVGPRLSGGKAKAALVEMLRRQAVRDPETCRMAWGSTEPDRELATATIRLNSNGTSQIGIFTARLGEEKYFFWAGPNQYGGTFEWDQGRWKASDYELWAHGCIIGAGKRQ
jgi:hypothetical protein